MKKANSKAREPLYSISILVIDNIQETRDCLNSIVENSDNYQLIITDNGSRPTTRDYLKHFAEEHENVGLIRNEYNAGFGPAHNHALSFALGAYFVTINNDSMVEGDWLELMRWEFRDPKVGQVGAYGSCCKLNGNCIGIFDDGDIEYIEASCMMIPTHVARKMKLFNSEFRKAYCEDVDLSLRIRKSGLRLSQARISWSHKRAITANSLPETEDLDGCRAYNHQLLRGKWSAYLEKRSFRERILIKRETAHGDVLLATPVVRELKRLNAEAEITFETAHPPVLTGNPDIDSITSAVIDGTFDRVFDLNLGYERDPEKHIVDAYAKICGIEVKNKIPFIHIPEKTRQWARKNLSNSAPWAVFHIGPTNWPGRHLNRSIFFDVSKYLRKKGFRIFVVGINHGSCPVEADYDFRDQTSTINQLAAVIERASLFVGIDSFPMHLAQCAKIPIVAVFGCILPEYRLAGLPFFKAVQAPNLGCLGCHHIGPKPKVSGVCLRGNPICMERITPDMICSAINEAMGAYSMQLETSKIRKIVEPYLIGKGIDIGCGRDKVLATAVGFDDDPSPEVNQIGDASGPLPYPDGFFNYVYSSHCLEDIADTERTLREWTRILARNGTIALYVPHPELYKGVNLEHKHKGFTPDQLEEFLVPLGFKTILKRTDEGENRYSSLYVGKKL